MRQHIHNQIDTHLDGLAIAVKTFASEPSREMGAKPGLRSICPATMNVVAGEQHRQTITYK